jgi:tRNA G10  N-methylase Trm11
VKVLGHVCRQRSEHKRRDYKSRDYKNREHKRRDYITATTLAARLHRAMPARIPQRTEKNCSEFPDFAII